MQFKTQLSLTVSMNQDELIGLKMILLNADFQRIFGVLSEQNELALTRSFKELIDEINAVLDHNGG